MARMAGVTTGLTKATANEKEWLLYVASHAPRGQQCVPTARFCEGSGGADDRIAKSVEKWC